MPTNEAVQDIGLDEYKYHFITEDEPVFRSGRGLNEKVVREISAQKGEPEWMLDFRLKSLDIYNAKPMPTWGGDLSQLESVLGDIFFYVRPQERMERSWDDVPANIKETFDRLGIDCQLLFPNHSGVYNEIADPGEARDLVRNHNDGMADAEHRSGGRLISTFCLPMQHPDEAIAELQRCVDTHTLRCAVICPNVDGGRIDELPLWDLFAEAERLGVVLAFHGDADTKQIGYERFDRWRLHNCLGFPFDYMHAMVCLIYSGCR